MNRICPIKKPDLGISRCALWKKQYYTIQARSWQLWASVNSLAKQGSITSTKWPSVGRGLGKKLLRLTQTSNGVTVLNLNGVPNIDVREQEMNIVRGSLSARNGAGRWIANVAEEPVPDGHVQVRDAKFSCSVVD